ncbi:DUF1284 domain-containing protein [uncultured Rummeliibacillus sp.]|uniref:DUF1284 domain-containing protein n=1 Tax=uncultured Rummeliibacillus sp. TaxID=762292 RepID=UPI002635FE90|nr:DUF1284 domain-containing protein [uncultured Rummeliibacillus sp.]
MYRLRGHHIFCLLGYRGMGYSKKYVENMTRLHHTLRKHPETLVQLVNGPDQLCENYPNSGEYHCQDDHIYQMDAAFLEKIGLKVGQTLKWADIESHIQNHVIPSDIQSVCKTCSWRSYGFCEDGIQLILDGKGLKEIK